MSQDSLDLSIGPERAGRRLDRVLAEALGTSRAETRRLLARGGVELDGRALDASAKGIFLEEGSRLRVDGYRPTAEQVPIAEPDEAGRFPILASGKGWVVLDKPAGTPVHPLREDERGTLLGAVVAREIGVVGVGEGGLRSGVVHRLDVDTSGAVVIATAQQSWKRLRRAFRDHRVTKLYRAIVAGRIELERGIELPLVVARHKPARVRVVEPERAAALGATVARQRVRPLETFQDATLVEVSLETGFLHQIRATFAHLGHPVLGDPTYASEEIAARAPRQMLHAAVLRFEEIEASSPDPADFETVLDALRD